MPPPIVPSLPEVPLGESQEVQDFLRAVKTILDSMRNTDGSYGGLSDEAVKLLIERGL